ncbi:B12-binding domain-containing radical SAM protein [Verrucomicrobiota bacterium]
MLVNPNVVVQRDDTLTTGIIYMPVGLAYLAAVLREQGLPCKVIDAFGEEPNQCRIEDRFLVRGLTPDQVVDRMPPQTSAVVIYAVNLTHHRSLSEIVRAVRERLAAVPVAVMENTQAVTAYSLRRVQESLYDLGVDYVITGEAEERGVELLRHLAAGDAREDVPEIDGIGVRRGGTTFYTPPRRFVQDLDSVPFPAWDLFPVSNYWRLRYAHGPLETGRYLPLLTSRGCPYPCRFCIIPETNGRKWRARTAANVVDEMAHFRDSLGVREFHVEDVDPTVNDGRTREICEEIIRRDLGVTWKLASGTKVETIKDEETVGLLAQAGCTYVSISPETGSPAVLSSMNKPFDLDHAVRMVRKMNAVGIASQACFVLGFPGETDDDLLSTRKLVRRLTKVGVDEIALFIVTPAPGSEIFESFSGYGDYSELTFSPRWRGDYAKLNRFRLKLYGSFLLWKLCFHPGKIAVQPFRFLARRFRTKMEMTPYRALHTMMLALGLAGRRVRGQRGAPRRAAGASP